MSINGAPGDSLGPGRTDGNCDQLSSMVLLRISVVGAVAAVLLDALIV
ncbi:hypothetical protein ACRAWG_38285 [Methylobacterium sp. P31]